MVRKLLIAYDGTDEGQEAFAFGLDLAKKYGAEMEILSVARPPEPPTIVETQAILDNATEHYEQLFKKLKERAEGEGLRIGTHVAVGHPAVQILHRAEQIHADVIVMGHRTQGALGRWLLGSVADRVLDHARCTVVVVKGKRP